MQQQPAIATVHRRNTETHETSGTVAQLMGDPVPFGNGIGAKQHSSYFTVSRTVETAVKGPQGEDEPVPPRLGERRWVRTRTTALESAP